MASVIFRYFPEQPRAAFGYRVLGYRHEQECHEQYGKAGAASLSTLSAAGHPGLLLGARALLQRHFLVCPADHIAVSPASAAAGALAGAPHHRQSGDAAEIGRASGRERV